MILALDLPNPVEIVTGGASEVAFGAFIDGLAGWLAESIKSTTEYLLDFFAHSTSPDPTRDWFAGSAAPYQTMAALGAAVMVLMILAAVIQGAATGEMGQVARRVVTRGPLVAVGVAVLLPVTKFLLGLTDAVSYGIAADAPEGVSGFLRKVLDDGATTGKLKVLSLLVVGVFILAASLVLVAELFIRNGVLLVVLALAPVGFAAAVWPSASEVATKLVRLWVALLLMKPVIAVAFAVGAAALGNTVEGPAARPFVSGGSGGTSGGESLGVLLAGAVVLGIAALSPMLLLKLMPVAEAALVAQGVRPGVSRSLHQTRRTATRLGVSAAAGAGGGALRRAGRAPTAPSGGRLRAVEEPRASSPPAEGPPGSRGGSGPPRAARGRPLGPGSRPLPPSTSPARRREPGEPR